MTTGGSSVTNGTHKRSCRSSKYFHRSNPSSSLNRDRQGGVRKFNGLTRRLLTRAVL